MPFECTRSKTVFVRIYLEQYSIWDELLEGYLGQ